MSNAHLFVAAILTAAYAIYAQGSSVISIDGSLGWTLTSKLVNALSLAIVFLGACGVVELMA